MDNQAKNVNSGVNNQGKFEMRDGYQTKSRGTNDNEYQIYTAFTNDNPPKTYDQWLNS